jgi:hypothetical protein
MRVKQYTLSGGGAADTAVYAALQAPTANVALTLTAAATGVALLATPRELTFTSAADLSAITFTIVGTDRWGSPATATLLGPNATTDTSKTIWQRLTSITPNATNAGTVSVGNPQRVVSPWVGLNTNHSTDLVPKAVISMETLSGAPTATAQFTVEQFTQYPADGARPMDSAATLNNTTVAEVQGTAVRVVLTSAAGSAKFSFARPNF